MPLSQEVLDSQDYKDAVATAITDATSPLQTSIQNLESTNAAIKTEKTQLAGEFNDFKTKFEGIDVEALQERLAEIDNEETRDLLAKGECDKAYEKQAAQLQAEPDMS